MSEAKKHMEELALRIVSLEKENKEFRAKQKEENQQN
jgi:hypothetical protein